MNQLPQLFIYDRWANRKTAAVLNQQPRGALQECDNLFAHIAASQKIWYNRINGDSSDDIELWPKSIPVSTAMESLEKIHEKWSKLLTSVKDEAVISYTNSKRTEFTTSITGILHHVVIHGQHHRAQIAMLLRQHEIEPPATDFIFYLREADNG